MEFTFPKPKNIKTPPVAVRVYNDRREQCNLLTKEGRHEYQRRKRVMWERQGRMCCLYGFIPECPGKLNWDDAAFAHEIPKGYGGGSVDDRIEVNGKRQNGAAHYHCNALQGSRRIAFNAAYNEAYGESAWQLLPDKTTNSGKVLFRCTRCGYETPAPTKNHQCGRGHN